MMWPRNWLLGVALGAVLLAGCESGPARQMPLRPTSSVHISDIDVPIGFRVDNAKSYSFADDQVRRAYLTYTGNAPVAKVVQFFLDQMPIRNWKLANRAANFGTTSMVFIKGPEVCTVSTYRSWGTTYIIVKLNKRPD